MTEQTCTAIVYPLFAGPEDKPDVCGARLTTNGAYPGYVRCSQGHLVPAPIVQAV